jgi:hypothetical protein
MLAASLTEHPPERRNRLVEVVVLYDDIGPDRRE